jgi:predicted nucleotide-binding protein (sugar kinase/HSP70/actin superfamily)
LTPSRHPAVEFGDSARGKRETRKRNTCRPTPTSSTGCSGRHDAGHIESPFDIADLRPSSYSANTNGIFWAVRFAARMPRIARVARLSSYECDMDQPTRSPVQQIVERSGTHFFSFQDPDSRKPAGSVKNRVETIAYYLKKYSAGIVAGKRATSTPRRPLNDR